MAIILVCTNFMNSRVSVPPEASTYFLSTASVEENIPPFLACEDFFFTARIERFEGCRAVNRQHRLPFLRVGKYDRVRRTERNEDRVRRI